MRHEYRHDIQVLRGICVVSVVLFHLFPLLFPSGYLGVDVFFTISGYVLASQVLEIFTTSNRKQNYLFFLKSRFWRLYPAFLSTIAFSLIAIFFLARPSVHERALKQVIYSILQIGDIGAFKFSGNYFDSTPNPFLHFWSLSVEWQFYVLLPLSLIALFSVKDYSVKLFTNFACLVLSISLLLWIYQDFIETKLVEFNFAEFSDGLGYFFSFGRMWQIILGMLVFVIFKESLQSKRSLLQTTAFLGFIFSLFFSNVGGIWGSIIISVLTAFMLSTIWTFKSRNRFAFNRVLAWVGYRSYSVYLVHFPLIVIFNNNVIEFDLSELAEFVCRSILFLVIFSVGHLMFIAFERRFRLYNRPFDRVRIWERRIFLSSCMLTMLIFYHGITAGYYGLNGNLQKPSSQHYIGKNCNGNSPQAIPCVKESNLEKGSVVLLGDSHAEHLSQTFAEVTVRNGYDYYGLGFCPPSLDYYKGKREGCSKFSAESSALVKSIKPDLMVISVFITNPSMARSVSKYINDLRPAAKETVVLYNSPVFKDSLFVDKPIFYGKQLFSKSIEVSKTDLTLSELSRNFAMNLGAKGIATHNLWSVFCDDKVCRRFVNNNWLFIDNNHLSTYGADLLESTFDKLFRDI